MMISCPLLAVAQDQSATNFRPLRIPLEPPESLPPSGTEGGHLFNLRPLGADFERTLANYGIHLQARDLSEVLSDVGGGVNRSAFFGVYTAAGIDSDMHRRWHHEPNRPAGTGPLARHRLRAVDAVSASEPPDSIGNRTRNKD
jgi:hypothetical protein